MKKKNVKFCFSFIKNMDDEEQILFLATLAAQCVGIIYLQKIKKRRKQSHRRWWVRPINMRRVKQGTYDNLIQEMRLGDKELFFNYTRMSVHMFDELMSLVGPHLKKYSQRQPIPEGMRLMISIRFLATGDSYKSLAYSYRIGVSTCCEIIRETCAIIWDILCPFYLKPLIQDQWRQIALQFEELWNLPNCVGSIDGKHVRIQAPNQSGSMFYNYKKEYSIVLLAVCDAQYIFRYVDIGAYGSQSDGGILKESVFGKKLINNELDLPPDRPLEGTNTSVPFYFVGDEAFPLLKNLLRPYGGKNQENETRIFNYRLSRARRCIENAFGILVSRWRLFHRTINASPTSVDNFIKATVCLHNFIKMNEDLGRTEKSYCPAHYADKQVNGVLISGKWRDEPITNSAFSSVPRRLGSRNASHDAVKIRDTIRDHVNSPEGAVPWQNNILKP